MSDVLELQHLKKRFGGLLVTHDVSLSLPQGARHALIGPNGAGKTTLINLLTGTLRPTGGRILLDGRDITGLKSYARVRSGIARTFQVNELFANFTPLETIAVAIGERLGYGSTWWSRNRPNREIAAEAADLSERFHLADVMEERTATLAYGKQRLLEIAVAFACRPRVLLLDEPAAGVPEAECYEIFDALDALPEHVTVLLVEHDMDLVFRFADRISVLVDGRLLLDGTPEEVRRDPRVAAVYLGELVNA